MGRYFRKLFYMENSLNAQKKSYTKLYTYSKKYISHRWLNIFITYGFSITVSVVAYFVTPLVKLYPDKTPIFIFYLILVLLCGGIGGLSPALLATIIISVVAFFKFGIGLSLEIVFFIIGAVVASLLIDSIRRTNIINRLKRQEKSYALSLVQLHDAYTKAQSEIKARDEFLSVVSHELRTPLTIMLLKLHNLLNTIQNVSFANFSVPQLMKVIKISEKQIKNLTAMINDLLDISLITTGRMKLKPEETDLVQITKKVLENFSEILKKEKYKIKFEANSAVSGKFDKARLEQAITNLLSNAIAYGEGKPISIQISNDKNIARLAIKDQGIGISPKDQELIFDLFKRTDYSNKHSNGLGVGLYITSQIIKAHKGRVKIYSKLQKGSTFILELPLKI